MFFDYNLKSSILLIFFLHGVVFSFLLFRKGWKNSDKSSIWLGVFTILCSFYIAPFMLGYAGWYSRNPYRDIMFYIPFQQLFLIPPVLYFYFLSFFDRSFIFSKKYLVHFIPAFLYLIYSVIVFITDRIFLREYFFYSDGRDKDLAVWYQLSGFLSLSFYLVLCIRVYRRYKVIAYDSVSFADSILFKWARAFLLAFVLLLGLRCLLFILNPEWAEFGKKFWYYLSFSTLFYYITISAYSNSVHSVISFQDVNMAGQSLAHDPLIESAQLPLGSGSTVGEADTKNQIPDLDAWKSRIDTLMESERIYENPELTITDLSNLLKTHSKKISQVINLGYGVNFNDFVNEYRAKAVIQKIEAGEHKVQTLLSIAFECGFNSKSTFNRAFKRYSSVSPKAYIEKHHKK